MFITFEGIDGAGKSTQIDRLRNKLAERGLSVVATREPGGTDIGDTIRSLLLGSTDGGMAPRAEALLYAASRAQLLHEVIRPALAAHAVVLCDRYVDASIAYQGAGLGIGIDLVGNINHFATGGLKPNLTFLFDLPVEESKERVRVARGQVQPDRIEQRNNEYFNSVRKEFLRIAADDEARVIVLDALQAADRLEQEIWRRTAKLLGLNESDR